MSVTANQILSGIASDDLASALVTDGDRFAVAFTINGEEVARVGCLRAEPPYARVSHDGRSVEVFASPGLPDGFEIQCSSDEDARVIAEKIEQCCQLGYLDLIDPDR